MRSRSTWFARARWRNTRFTSQAIHGAASYDESGVAEVTQVLGLNLYDGWYSGTLNGFGAGLDRRHARSPRQAIVVSEYGSGSELRVNSAAPERFDHSGAYHRLYHESYLRQANARPWLAGTAIWNQFDFSQPHIGESTPHMNKKGMLTFDRRTKDVYFMYRANWNPEPESWIDSPPTMPRRGFQVLIAISDPPGTDTSITTSPSSPNSAASSAMASVIIRRGTGLIAGSPGAG